MHPNHDGKEKSRLDKMFDALEEVFSAVMNWFDSPAAHAFDVSEFMSIIRMVP